MNRLKQTEVTNAKPKRGRFVNRLLDGGGLYLQATAGKDGVNRNWVFRYELDGVRHDMGLGPLHTIGLAKAREIALELRQQIKAGIDPLASRDEAKKARRAELARAKAEQAKAMTFKQCAEMYIAAHANGWKSDVHRKQWSSTLSTYAFPIMGDLSVSDIETAHIVKAVDPIWARIPETAKRVQSRIATVMDYATARGFRTGANPARWAGHLDTLLPARGKIAKVEHHAALPFAEIPQFMAELHGKESTSARALEFVILTGVRTSEAIGATWDEIDLKGKTWTVPGERMKGGRTHRVPLSSRAVAILEAMSGNGGAHVFAGSSGQPLSNMAMLELLRGMRPGLTVHGFRSTFRDWSAEKTNFPEFICEMALAHVVGDAVVKAYKRTDVVAKRRELMKRWADYCAKPPKKPEVEAPLPKKTATVTHLRVVGAR